MESKRCPACLKLNTAEGACPHCGYDGTTGNASHQLQIGTVLKEQYLIGRVLGQGGFGITYLGWDLYLDIPVAIKEYYPGGMVMREATVTMNVSDISGDDGARFRNNRDRFLREAKMLARFSQMPDIVQIKNFFLTNNPAYIVMEYVEGITLKQHVKSSGGKLSVEETFSILRPMIQTLSKVHKTGIVHRDISPDNIMMLPQGGAKLLDFGAVRDVTGAEAGKELTKSTEAILKQGYAPIEQYQKKGSLGPWTDVYALCATIYYCLTGEVPPDSPARVLAYEEMDMEATGLNESQQAALLHGMALRVEDRTRSMEELYQELFGEKEAPAPVAAPQPKAVEKSVKPQASGQEQPRKTAPKQTPAKERKKSGGRGIAILAALAAMVVLVIALSMGGKTVEDPLDTGEAAATVTELASGTFGQGFRWTLDSGGLLTVTGEGDMPDFRYSWHDNEPSMQDRELAPWESYINEIRSLRLEGGITSVGRSAFEEMRNLEAVDLGNHLTSIMAAAFSGTGLVSIEFPETLEIIDVQAFAHTRLTTVELPDSLQYLDREAFIRCPELVHVTIGPNTTLCMDDLNDLWREPIFTGADGRVPEYLVLRGYSGGIVEEYARITGCQFASIGKAEPEGRGVVTGDITWWFDEETGFLKISGSGDLSQGFFGGNYVHKGSSAWGNNEPIPWEKFRNEIRVVSIGDEVYGCVSANLFENHGSLNDVYFGKGIDRIGEYAFAGTNIDHLHLPDGVALSPYAFDHCMELRYVCTPLDLIFIPKATFNQCLNIEQMFTASCLEDGSVERYNPFVSYERGEMDLPQNMVIYTLNDNPLSYANRYDVPVKQGLDGKVSQVMGEAGSSVFWSLENGTLTLFGSGSTSFFNCGREMLNAWNDGGKGQTTSDKHAGYYPYRDEIEHIVIQPGVTQLNLYTFCDMPNLKSIDFGEVTHVFCEAISNCGLEEVVFPASVVHIREKAIMDCRNLRTIKIQNGSEFVGHILKDHLPALEEVIFLGNPSIQRLFDQMLTQEVTVRVLKYSTAEDYARDSQLNYQLIQ